MQFSLVPAMIRAELTHILGLKLEGRLAALTLCHCFIAPPKTPPPSPETSAHQASCNWPGCCVQDTQALRGGEELRKTPATFV